MNRRAFLRSLLGLAAAAALPAQAIELLAKTSSVPDAEFTEVATAMYGAIRNVRVWDRALSAEELRRMTI